MKPVTADLLCAIVQAPRAGKHVPIVAAIARDLPDIQREHAINTPLRLAHFIAQIAHESDGFRTVSEYASGKAYEGRADLGNTQPGDGVRFKGRGLIQLTGRANYRKFGRLAGLNLEAAPEAAANLLHVTELAALFWTDRDLNRLADADHLEAITRAINGGRNGLMGRRLYLERAKKAIGG